MSGRSRQNPVLWLLGTAIVSIVTFVLQAKLSAFGEAIPSWAFLAIMAIGLPFVVIKFRDELHESIREYLDFLELRWRHSDVIENERFPFVLKHYLKVLPKEDKGIISFYNVPLATLQDPTARKELWVNAIGLNPRVKEFHLFLPKEKLDDLIRGLTVIKDDDPSEGLGTMEKLIRKITVVVVSFPPEEVLNFACMLEDDFQHHPIFSSTTIMAPPFWNGQKFSHFFAFRGDKKHTQGVCALIRDHIRRLWETSRRNLPEAVEFDYPATASHESVRRMTVTVERVILQQQLLDAVLGQKVP